MFMAYIDILMSSGCFAIAIATLGLILMFLLRLKNMLNFKALWKLILVVPVVGFFIFQSGALQRMYRTFAGFENLNIKIPRLTIWKLHLQLFLEKPWFGYGSIDLKTMREALYISSGNSHLQD